MTEVEQETKRHGEKVAIDGLPARPAPESPLETLCPERFVRTVDEVFGMLADGFSRTQREQA